MRFVAGAGATQYAREGDVFRVVDGFVDLPKSLGDELGLVAAPEAAALGHGKSDGGIATVNAEKAKALIEAVTTLEELEVLANAERERKDGPRVSVTRAIEEKAAALGHGK